MNKLSSRVACIVATLFVTGVASAATYTFPTYTPSPTTFSNTNVRTFDLTTLGQAPIGSWLTGTITVAWDGGSVAGSAAQWSNEARAGLSSSGRAGTIASPTGGGTNYASLAAATTGAAGSSAPTTLTWNYSLANTYAGGTNPLFLDFGQSFFSSTTPTANANWNSVTVTLGDVPPPLLAPSGLITDIGVLGNSSNTYAVPDRTISVSTTATNRVHYIKFTLPQDVLSGAGNFLDIDTGASPDSVIGLYRAFSSSSAVVQGTDDDDGPGGVGAGSALSFGASTPARGPIAVDAVAGNGRDGSSLGAGTYYLAVGGYASGYAFNANFGLGTFSATPATYTLNFRTNIPEPTTLASLAGLSMLVGRKRR